MLERIQCLNDMSCPFNEPLHHAQLATWRTDLLLPSLILHDPTSPSFPTCTSIMRAKGRKDLGVFSFLINTIFVITEFLWNMKYITVAIVATVNKNTVCIYAKNCFCFKVQSYSCKFSVPRKLSGFSVARFLRKTWV